MGQRIPPHSLEAEAALLGAMLLSRDAIFTSIELLTPDAFYHEVHKIIYQAIVQLFDENKPVDLVTLIEKLKEKGTLEQVGGEAYVAQLLDVLPTPANVKEYINIIHDRWLQRQLISAGNKIIDLGYSSNGDARSAVDRAEQMIFDILSDKVFHEITKIGDLLHESFEQIENLYQKKAYISGISTGFVDLDQATAGLHPGDLIIVAGRPSMGKSSFCLNIAQNVAIRTGAGVGIFSLEMSKEQVVLRMLCSEAKVDTQKVRTGKLSKEDWSVLTQAAARLQDAPIYIDDTPNMPILELKAKARRIKAKANIELLLIDYLQLIECAVAETRQQEIAQISRALKALAKEINVPLIALSQLSRAPEIRQDQRPRLSDLRESGAIEQDADVVLFIYREEMYKPDSDKKGTAEIIIGKQRHGPTQTVNLTFLKHCTRFEDMYKAPFNPL